MDYILNINLKELNNILKVYKSHQLIKILKDKQNLPSAMGHSFADFNGVSV